MGNHTVTGFVHSLKETGDNLREMEMLDRVGDNDYIVEYNGVKCHAIFNPFVGQYYADDIYGRVEE